MASSLAEPDVPGRGNIWSLLPASCVRMEFNLITSSSLITRNARAVIPSSTIMYGDVSFHVIMTPVRYLNDIFAAAPKLRRRTRNTGNSNQAFPLPGTSGPARLSCEAIVFTDVVIHESGRSYRLCSRQTWL